MELVLLALVLLACLVLVPVGLPGLWVMLGVAFVFDRIVAEPRIGIWAILVGVAIAAAAEVLEFILSSRYARMYGGSRRAEWGAILGGIVGAVAGFPVPVIGSVIGAFIGSFIGALVGELSRGSSSRVSGKAAWGAFLGRIVATVAKISLGFVLLFWLMLMAWR